MLTSNLNAVSVKLKNGSERLKTKHGNLSYSLLDFWRWSASDILSNATRGRFAEFIVASALGIDLKIPRDEWAAYDLTTPDGLRIEVKSGAYLQSWSQKNFSTITFSIKKSRYWSSKTLERTDEYKRQADIYIFCLLTCKDKSKVDPLDLEQWEFFIVPTEKIDNYERSESSITLSSLERLTNSVKYDKLKEEVDAKRKYI